MSLVGAAGDERLPAEASLEAQRLPAESSWEQLMASLNLELIQPSGTEPLVCELLLESDGGTFVLRNVGHSLNGVLRRLKRKRD